MPPRIPCRRLAAIAIAIAIGAGTARAEMRPWTSADGGRTLVAEFVGLKGDKITLKRDDGRLITFSMEILSAADQRLARNLAAAADDGDGTPATGAAVKAGLAVFDQFRFGESRDEVLAKLRENHALEGGMIDAFLARTGLNGIFYVDLNGDRFDLFFAFDDDDRLREIALQSSHFDPAEYNGALKSAWSRLRSAFVLVHGEPTLSTGYPARSQISEGASMSSDIWNLDDRALYLGTGMIEGEVSCVLRCTAGQYEIPAKQEQPADK